MVYFHALHMYCFCLVTMQFNTGILFLSDKTKKSLVAHLPQLSWDTFLEDQLGACVFLMRYRLYLLSWFRRLSTEEMMLFKRGPE